MAAKRSISGRGASGTAASGLNLTDTSAAEKAGGSGSRGAGGGVWASAGGGIAAAGASASFSANESSTLETSRDARESGADPVPSHAAKPAASMAWISAETAKAVVKRMVSAAFPPICRGALYLETRLLHADGFQLAQKPYACA